MKQSKYNKEISKTDQKNKSELFELSLFVNEMINIVKKISTRIVYI
jgi:hypothetical protein